MCRLLVEKENSEHFYLIQHVLNILNDELNLLNLNVSFKSTIKRRLWLVSFTVSFFLFDLVCIWVMQFCAVMSPFGFLMLWNQQHVTVTNRNTVVMGSSDVFPFPNLSIKYISWIIWSVRIRFLVNSFSLVLNFSGVCPVGALDGARAPVTAAGLGCAACVWQCCCDLVLCESLCVVMLPVSVSSRPCDCVF